MFNISTHGMAGKVKIIQGSLCSVTHLYNYRIGRIKPRERESVLHPILTRSLKLLSHLQIKAMIHCIVLELSLKIIQDPSLSPSNPPPPPPPLLSHSQPSLSTISSPQSLPSPTCSPSLSSLLLSPSLSSLFPSALFLPS